MLRTVVASCLCLIILSCQKEKPLKEVNYTLVYEVITTGGSWFGEYIDSSGKKVSSNGPLPSGWKYTFKKAALPFDMHVDATVNCSCQGSANSPDVTINFYSNGELFKTSTNTWAKGVASLDFNAR